VALSLASCGDTREAAALTPLIAPAATSVISSPPLNETPEPTSHAELVDDCVALVPVGAYVGNALLMEMWRHALEDVAVLRQNCDDLAKSNPAALQSLSDVWHDLERSLAAPAPPVPPRSD
jgi:hypothetical protein